MTTEEKKATSSPFQAVLNFILYSIWLLLQFTYQYSHAVHDSVRHSWKNLSRFLSRWDYKKQIIELNEKVKKFEKVPKHLAISVQIDENSVLEHKDKLRLVQDVARNVSYAYAVDIRMVSLYDPKGLLKTLQSKLHRSITKEITRTKLILDNSPETKKPEDNKLVTELPTVKIHNCNANGNMDADLGKDVTGDTMNVFIFSRDDGKPVIIECIKDIYRDYYKDKPANEKTKPQVTEKMLDTYINRYIFGGLLEKLKIPTEPDLMMVFGQIKSTMGFLPWHIRLSEIHWMPPIHKADAMDFIGSLAKFSGCQQRFGK